MAGPRAALRAGVTILCLAPLATAQTDPPDRREAHRDSLGMDHAEALLDPLVEDATSADPTDLLELLEGLLAHPIDLNEASAEALALVPGLTPRLAAAIVAHRREAGPFTSVEQIRQIPGIAEADYLAARPYLTATPPAADAAASPYPALPRLAEVRSGIRIELLQRVQRRLDLARGYEAVPDSLIGTPDEPRRYLGSPERLYTRLQATYRRNLSANITLEKDPGEPFMWDPARGFYGYDFVSLHLAALRMGRVEALVLGDYVAEFGQGLTLWRASGFGKGRDPIGPLVRRGRGIRPYASTDENRFFRGAAATLALTPSIYATVLASRRRYDARFGTAASDTAASDPLSAVVGLPLSGLHRTRSEIEAKQSLGQTLGGAGLELRAERATVGVVGYHARFDAPLARGHQPYQRFHFSGDRASMVSVYGNLLLGPYYLFAEVARAPEGRFGGVVGAQASLGTMDAVLIARHYPAAFTSFHGYGFGERNGATRNETGAYFGLRLRPHRQWTVAGYFDQFRFPWPRFGVNRPSSGHDGLIYLEHRPRQWLLVYLQGRSKTREVGQRVTLESGASLDALTAETRQSLRLQGEFLANRDLRLRARIETSRYRRGDAPAAGGVLFFHDARWALSRRVTIDARLTHFDTEGFGARLFQFENDLLGVLTNTLLHGRGTRFYALLTLRPGGAFRGLDARLKYATTEYRDRHAIGSGLDRIEGRRVRDVGVQIRYRIGG